MLKKVRDGRLRFVFQKGIGDVMTFGEEVYARPVSEEEIRAILMEMYKTITDKKQEERK